MTNETGFSTAQINSDADDAAWRTVLPLMRAGGVLRWDSRTRRAYVGQHGGLTKARVRKMVASRVIREAGPDSWVLADG